MRADLATTEHNRKEARMTFQQLYNEISKDRDTKAYKLQQRRWNRLNGQLGLY